MRLKIIGIVALSLVFGAMSAGSSRAQGPIVPPIDGSSPTTGTVITSPNSLGPSMTASRIGAGGRRGTTRVSAPVSPEVAMANAQTVATAAGTSCQVTSAEALGLDPQQHAIYEATCATGPGYLLVDTTPPQAIDCVLLAGQAELELARRAASPQPPSSPPLAPPVACRMAANQNVVAVIGAYAQRAGVTCQVDQGIALGSSVTGGQVYEAGCNGADGYWVERTPTGWIKTACIELVSQGDTCRFSTAAEQAATLKARFAGNAEASPCDVTQARYMGANANGSFYEARCGAGNGVIVRLNTAEVVQQVYPCETAQQIGGGCTLTVATARP